LKILYLTNGMSSTLNSSFEVSRRLRVAGHEVVYASPADVGERVAAEGYGFVHLRADRDFAAHAASVPLGRQVLGRPVTFASRVRQRRRIRRASIENDEIERVVRELQPDRLLIDIELHFAILATAKLGIPTLLPIVWFTLYRHSGTPPLHTPLHPSGAGGGALRVAWSWRRLRASTLIGETRRRVGQAARGEWFSSVDYDTVKIEDLRAVARSRAFDLRAETDRSQWLRPYLYRNFPILLFNVPEMDFPLDPFPNEHYVGPMILAERRETQVDDRSLEAWQAFSSGRESGRPLVYCSLGSFWAADVGFLRKVVDVFRRRTDWDLVLGLGGVLDSDALGPVPSNVLALEFAPQLEVLQRAQCAITHGGITTINECVAHGVSMLVYSTNHVDQDGCAARVSYRRLGVVGDRAADDSRAIETKLAEVLEDEEIRRNVGSMRQHFQRYEQRNEVVELIEKAVRVGS